MDSSTQNVLQSPFLVFVMPKTLPKKLEKLNAFLASNAIDNGGLHLSEMDGFFAGLIVSPDIILPSEWLPMVWGKESFSFKSRSEAETIITLIMNHFTNIGKQLDNRRYCPIYDVEEKSETFVWKQWMEGFEKAKRLRPLAWQGYLDNKTLLMPLSILSALAILAASPSETEQDEETINLGHVAPGLIPLYVEKLYRARLAYTASLMKSANEQPTKVGRNEQCPCGSGKKHKKCCLKIH